MKNLTGIDFQNIPLVNATATTQSLSDSSSFLATTAYVQNQAYLVSSALTPYALLAGGTFSGAVTVAGTAAGSIAYFTVNNSSGAVGTQSAQFGASVPLFIGQQSETYNEIASNSYLGGTSRNIVTGGYASVLQFDSNTGNINFFTSIASQAPNSSWSMSSTPAFYIDKTSSGYFAGGLNAVTGTFSGAVTATKLTLSNTLAVTGAITGTTALFSNAAVGNTISLTDTTLDATTTNSNMGIAFFKTTTSGSTRTVGYIGGGGTTTLGLNILGWQGMNIATVNDGYNLTINASGNSGIVYLKAALGSVQISGGSVQLSANSSTTSVITITSGSASAVYINNFSLSQAGALNKTTTGDFIITSRGSLNLMPGSSFALGSSGCSSSAAMQQGGINWNWNAMAAGYTTFNTGYQGSYSFDYSTGKHLFGGGISSVTAGTSTSTPTFNKLALAIDFNGNGVFSGGVTATTGSYSGILTVLTASASTNTTQAASTAYVTSAISAAGGFSGGPYAALSGATFTGSVTNTTTLYSNAAVQNVISITDTTLDATTTTATGTLTFFKATTSGSTRTTGFIGNGGSTTLGMQVIGNQGLYLKSAADGYNLSVVAGGNMAYLFLQSTSYTVQIKAGSQIQILSTAQTQITSGTGSFANINGVNITTLGVVTMPGTLAVTGASTFTGATGFGGAIITGVTSAEYGTGEINRQITSSATGAGSNYSTWYRSSTQMGVYGYSDTATDILYYNNLLGNVSINTITHSTGGNLGVPGTLVVTGTTTLSTGTISGIITAPTATAGTSTTQLATTAFVTNAIQVGAGTVKAYTRISAGTATYTVLATDEYVSIDASVGVTITLPSPAILGKVYTLHRYSINQNNQAIQIGAGSSYIESLTTAGGKNSFIGLSGYGNTGCSVTLIGNGTDYEILSVR